MKIEWAYAAGLVAFLGVAWASTRLTQIFGDKADFAFYWLAALGVTGTALIYFLRDKWNARHAAAVEAAAGGSPVPAAGGAAAGDSGEVDVLVRDAEARFAASRVAQASPAARGGLTGMPVVLLVGEHGAAKTTIFENSGLEPELLAGQAPGVDGSIAPTRAANLWFARKAVFVEAGGKLWADTEGWGRLLKKLTPSHLKSLVGGRGQAPRAAVLCVDVERFLQPGAQQTMANAARAAQGRLQEISQKFGIQFPVYVLFTRCDRLTYFPDYFRNISHEEAGQVLGTTLPLANFDGGLFAQKQTERLAQACEELFYSLADRRIEYLPRENDNGKLPACYEFPREFRKLKNAIVPFLVDICRPSQLQTTPYLRGFYFSGVRMITVADVAPAPRAPAAPVRSQNIGATSLFNVPQAVPSAPASAHVASGGRTVSQWLFLTRLFNEVILEDKAAMGGAGPSAQASTLRRILLGTAAALALLWSLLATVSFFKNRGLENDLIGASEEVRKVRLAPGGTPQEADLKRLDGLREKLILLNGWKREGAPAMYRWGLYTGDDLRPLARQAYYKAFEQLLFRETRQDRLLSYLRSRPSKADPQDNYNYGYHALRSYLLTTKEWERTKEDQESEYLGGQLRDRWLEGHRGVEQNIRELAEKQFVFYAGDLRNGNPYSDREEAEAVKTARVWLGSFPMFESLYNAMLNEADKKAKTVNYNREYPGTATVVVNNKDVRGAFTRDGWAAMQAIFKKPNISASEQWVLPDEFKKSRENPSDMLAQIRERYVSDYIKRWRAYFNTDTNVLGYKSVEDAADKLKEHSGARPAVVYLIGLASANTAPEPASDPVAQKVRDAFLWAHAVVPPGQFLGGKNEGYVSALQELQMSAEAAKARSSETARALDDSQRKAQMVAQTVGRPPRLDQEGGLDRKILEILVKPTQVPVEQGPNIAMKAICDQFASLKQKFPFNPKAIPDLPVDELDAFLKPGAGSFWQLYETGLKNVIVKFGKQFQPNPAAPANVNPDALRFLNEMARLADAMYPGGQGPRLNYTVQLAEVDLVLDGTKAKSGSISIDGKKADLGGDPQAFTWTGAPNHSVSFEYNASTSFRCPGPSCKEGPLWAIFRFFVDATVSPSGNGYLLTWPVRGGAANQLIANAKFNVNLNGAPAVFDARVLNGMRCAAQAVK